MRQAETIVWAGGEHDFRLGIGELRIIEQRSNAGISVVLARILGGLWYVDDIVGVLRVGLIGGGMDQKEAQSVIDRVLDESSLAELSVPASEVLRRFIIFQGGDQPGEAQAGAGNQTPDLRFQTDLPDGQTSSPPEPPADSPQETSTT